jgi:hypothetical protein
MGVLGKLAAKVDQLADKTIAKRVDAVVDESNEVARQRGKSKTEKKDDE